MYETIRIVAVLHHFHYLNRPDTIQCYSAMRVNLFNHRFPLPIGWAVGSRNQSAANDRCGVHEQDRTAHHMPLPHTTNRSACGHKSSAAAYAVSCGAQLLLDAPRFRKAHQRQSCLHTFSSCLQRRLFQQTRREKPGQINLTAECE